MLVSIPIKNQEQVALIRQSALLVSDTLSTLASILKPGVTTLALDAFAEEFIRSHTGATPSFKNYKGFPFSSCISVNEEVVHGFPSARVLKENDVVSIDVGVYMNGFHGDSAFTFWLRNDAQQEDEGIRRLLNATREALTKAIAVCRQGHRLGDIGYAVQSHCEAHQFGVVRELTGHGIGKQLHEPPNIPNYGKRGQGIKLQSGMVLAIEPMITLGKHHVMTESDGWTITTKDRKIAAHFEHTVAITKGEAEPLSDFSKIDAVVAQNEHLVA